MWVILHSALEEFRLRESRTGELDDEVVQALERKVASEALTGALRIAGLVGDSYAKALTADTPLPRRVY